MVDDQMTADPPPPQHGYSFDAPVPPPRPLSLALLAAINAALADHGLVLVVEPGAEPVVSVVVDPDRTAAEDQARAQIARDAANDALIGINDALAAEDLSIARGEMVGQPTKYWIVRKPKLAPAANATTITGNVTDDPAALHSSIALDSTDPPPVDPGA